MQKEFTKISQKILNLIKIQKFDIAKKNILLLKKLNSPAEIILALEGVIEAGKKNYESSIAKFIEAIKFNPNYLFSYINIVSVYEKLKKFDIAEEYIKKALKLKNDSDVLNNTMGYNLFKQNRVNEAINFFEISININPLNYKAFFNLGNSYFKLSDYKNAIKFFNKTIKININCPEVHFFLAESLKNIEKYEEALINYKVAQKEKNTWLRKEKINAKILEIYLILNKKEDYIKDIFIYSKEDPDNRRIAATSAFIAHQFNVKDQYPFCPNPLDFIYKSTLENYVNDYQVFLDSLFDEIMSLNFVWEGHTTRNGYRTTENLSEKKLPLMSRLEKYILLELNKYYQIHKHKKITFIQNWPNKFKFQSWSNRLTKQGHNITHIHPGGWISAVFYLKIPKDIKNNEAGIEFSLHGDNYYVVNNNIPTKVLHPAEGNIVLFPSSLFHKTIPFESDEERVSVAMDLCKY